MSLNYHFEDSLNYWIQVSCYKYSPHSSSHGLEHQTNVSCKCLKISVCASSTILASLFNSTIKVIELVLCEEKSASNCVLSLIMQHPQMNLLSFELLIQRRTFTTTLNCYQLNLPRHSSDSATSLFCSDDIRLSHQLFKNEATTTHSKPQ